MPPAAVLVRLARAFPSLDLNALLRSEPPQTDSEALQAAVADQRRVNAILFAAIRAINARTGAGLNLDMNIDNLASEEPAVAKLLHDLGIAEPA